MSHQSIQFVSRSVPPDAEKWLQNEGFNPLISSLMASRGVVDPDDLNLSILKMLNPADLKGATLAGQLLAKSIMEKKIITVVADYDCDGASACAIMIRGLKLLGAQAEKVNYLVPDRQLDGYGLTPPIVDRVIEKFKTEVLITVDNGIASFDGVKHAIELGIQVIVTDHHLPAIIDGEIRVPNATVIVNPSQPGCNFPSKSMCGAGVAFYTILMTRSALREMNVFSTQNQPKVDSLLQLVALATIADVVMLDANNRRLVANGLERIKSPNGMPGIRALFEVAGRNPDQANSTDMGFTIGPRINAAGRMSDMTIGIETLLTDNAEKAKELANQLHTINLERRAVESSMVKEADKIVCSFEALDPDGAMSAIVVYDEAFHEGVVGIVAGKIKESKHRPTFVFAKSHTGDLKGSGRSIPGFHLRDALDLISKLHPNLILKFGGHSMAAGCTIAPNGLDLFRQALNKVAKEWLTEDMLNHKIMTDGSLHNRDFNVDMVKHINSCIWGQGFEAPIFVDEGRIVDQKIVGEKHLKISVDMDGLVRSGIWFGRSEMMEENAQVRLAYRVDINEWRGRQSVQIMVDGLA